MTAPLQRESLSCLQSKVQNTYPLFEHGIWKIHNGNCNLTVLGIYHPPANKKANTQDAVFVEELINLLTDLLLNHSNIIIIGDFNMHWNKPEDPNISILEENATVLGLTQIFTSATHRNETSLI